VELVFVFGRLLFSSVSNVYQKKLTHRGLHPFYVVATTYLVLGLLATPLLGLVDYAALSDAFWVNVFFAALLDVGGWLFLVLSLSRTDLSVFGPLNAYKVIISMLLAVLFLGEIPSLQGVLGVLVILIGSFFLIPAKKSGTSAFLPLLLERGVQSRFLSILLFSIGTIFLKNSVVHGGPLATLVFWSLLGLPMVLLSNAVFLPGGLRKGRSQSREQIGPILLIGVTVFVMQYLTLVLLSRMLVAYTLALFQLGMMLQVFLGHKIFKEEHLLRRLLACSVMVIGSVVVLLA
jgi:drug/metabolite transporter (DMT)-like permease